MFTRLCLTTQQIERLLVSLDQREEFAPQGAFILLDTYAAISEIIHDQNASFMAFAEQVASLHAEIDTLKKDYVKWYQLRFQSVCDPFAPGAAAAGSA